MDLGTLLQRMLASVATAALLGIFGLAWSAFLDLRDLTTDVAVIKTQMIQQVGTAERDILRLQHRLDKLEAQFQTRP